MSEKIDGVLDTNTILRFLLRDTEEQYQKSSELIFSGKKLLLTDVVIAEIVYILQKLYRLEKSKISIYLKIISEHDSIVSNIELLQAALDTYSNSKLSFADSYLLALGEMNNTPVYTYDKQMLKFRAAKRP